MSEIEQPAPPADEPVEEVTPTAIAAKLSGSTIAAQHRPAQRITASPGEYLSAFMTNSPALANIRATVALDTVADVPGIIPTPILAPVFSALEQARPLITALGSRAMPAGGKVFIRPRISVHVTVAEQAAEGDQLSSTALEIDDIQVTKLTFGGTVDVTSLTYSLNRRALLLQPAVNLFYTVSAPNSGRKFGDLQAGLLALVANGTLTAALRRTDGVAYATADAHSRLPTVVDVTPTPAPTVPPTVGGLSGGVLGMLTDQQVRQTDRQLDRHTDRQTDRHIDI